jgi:hypothetical protein
VDYVIPRDTRENLLSNVKMDLMMDMWIIVFSDNASSLLEAPFFRVGRSQSTGGDGKLTRGNYDDPDDCPRCKYRRGCPYGMPGLGMHRCNQGIFEAEK